MSKNYEWHDKTEEFYFCDPFGKILGSVNIISGGIYMARYDNVVLGKYISEETAKSAVEKEFNVNYI